MELTAEETRQVVDLARKNYTPSEISQELSLPIAAIFPTLREKKLMASHEDITKEAINALRQDNMDVAIKIGALTARTMDKAMELVSKADSPEELHTVVKVAEVVARIRGMIPKEAQTNVQINNIIGFEFVSIAGQEDLVQIDYQDGVVE